jgi:hypothetical protein
MSTICHLSLLFLAAVRILPLLAFRHSPPHNPTRRSHPIDRSPVFQGRSLKGINSCLPLLHLSSSGDSSDSDSYETLVVAGASVSPIGFLAIVKSSLQQQEIAFPIQLTSSTLTNTAYNGMTGTESIKNASIPSLFQENVDQTSVVTPEALTFLQLINGVDMATPILPPDTLSKLCVWYAFLLDKQDGDSIISDRFHPGLDYVRSIVQTTLTLTGESSSDFLELSRWKRGKVMLPRVKLGGVRVEEVDMSYAKQRQQSEVNIQTIPLKFTLECCVDDDAKPLEIPLFAIPESCVLDESQTDRLIQISNKVLEELSHSFNVGTSASFMTLSLLHRYRKSGGEAPQLRISQHLLRKLADLQNEITCWLTKHNSDNLDTLIQSTALPMYRPLSNLKESDQRVLQHLKDQNFGKNPNLSGVDPNPQTSKATRSHQSKKQLTLEQQVRVKRLKSAWKIATEKNDTAALEKIQKAMEDFEKEVESFMQKSERGEGEETSLQKIQRAMRDGDGVEEVVGLISELEEAMDDNGAD